MAREKYLVEVIIENKPFINDPEGETIHRDLVLKGGYSAVTSVRAAKLLKLTLRSGSKLEAERSVRKLCDDLRLYNPVASTCTVRAVAKPKTK